MTVAADLLVIVPVLGRPHRARPLVESLAEATAADWRLVFVCTPGDTEQIDACADLAVFDQVDVLVASWSAGKADWARKCELARQESAEPLMLLGADDIAFEAGWDTAVIDVFDRFDVGVVGTNDMANPAVKAGRHSTHPVVARCYADAHGTVDDPGLMLPVCYWHNQVDVELVETAKARGCWAFAPGARVRHSHPFWQTAPDDATYRLGREHDREDRALLMQRRRLWEREAVLA